MTEGTETLSETWSDRSPTWITALGAPLQVAVSDERCTQVPVTESGAPVSLTTKLDPIMLSVKAFASPGAAVNVRSPPPDGRLTVPAAALLGIAAAAAIRARVAGTALRVMSVSPWPD
jgi:hypothetical protein